MRRERTVRLEAEQGVHADQSHYRAGLFILIR